MKHLRIINKLLTPFSFTIASIALSACSEQSTEQSSVQVPITPSAAVAEVATAVSNEFGAEQVQAQLHRHIEILAADEFEGRAPATPGEEKTINFLRDEFAALGLGPGNGESYFQPVAVTEITTASDATVDISGSAYQVSLSYGDETVVGSQHQVEQVQLSGSELVFVGYGINAPERNWNDYANVDVTDKTVVILVNDPGYATQDPDLFNGNAMTYYGRWVYKYEEAARQGAAAALIVHETGPAGYPWDVVNSSWTGPQIGLQAENLNADKTDIEGWITLDIAEALFSGAGLEYQQLKTAAAQAGFSAVPMADLKLNVSINNSIRNSSSQNVIASIPGSERPDETIIYTAHWDHLGVNPELEGDQIFNGAVDNATGTAALLALAKLHSLQAEPPARTLVFLAVTAEESGLLGSKWYAEHPIYPLPKTVANINMDAMGVQGPMRDIVVVGYNSSELEAYLEEAAVAQGRYLSPEPNPERGYYYRSDHFNFAKVGVPALYTEYGEDSIEHGREWGAERSAEYTNQDYHAPSDEYDADWDLSGMVQDIMLYFNVGQKLSQESTFPNWLEGNEFKAIRDAARAGL